MKRTLGLISTIIILFAANAYALEALTRGEGEMVSFNPYTNEITARVEVLGLLGPEKQDIVFPLAEDAKWTICLLGGCVERKGIEGFNMLNEYAPFEAYGVLLEGSKVILHHQGGEVIAVWVIAP